MDKNLLTYERLFPADAQHTYTTYHIDKQMKLRAKRLQKRRWQQVHWTEKERRFVAPQL